MKKLFTSTFFVKLRELASSLSDKLQNSTLFNKKPGKKMLIIGFSLIVLALAIFSAAVLIDENTAVPVEGTTSQGDIDPAVLNNPNAQQVSADYLLVFSDTEKTQVMSALVLTFNSEAQTIQYRFIPTDAYIAAGGVVGPLSTHLISGGANQLILAAESVTGLVFERYLIGNESSFVHLMELLGDSTVEIDSRVSYSHNGVSFIIDEGIRTLTADMMLKYCLYLMNTPGNEEKILSLLVEIVERLVSAEGDEQLESNFCSAIGFFDTNVTANDYATYKEIIRSIPQMELAENAMPME